LRLRLRIDSGLSRESAATVARLAAQVNLAWRARPRMSRAPQPVVAEGRTLRDFYALLAERRARRRLTPAGAPFDEQINLNDIQAPFTWRVVN
jgi:hypothetical protein